MKKSAILSLVGGVLMCLPMLFFSCGNADNALEQIINGGGSNETQLAQLTDAIKSNAKVLIEYTLYGDTKAKQIEFTFDGGLEQFAEVEDIVPDNQNYVLFPSLEYDKASGVITFSLIATIQVPTTRSSAPPLQKVLVVVFDVKAKTYKVASLPGFSFKVVKIEGLPVDVENAWPESSEIALKQITDYESTDNYETAFIDGMEDYPFVINYEEGKTWGDLIGFYTTLLDNEDVVCHEESTGSGYMSYINLDFTKYEFIYGFDNVFMIFSKEKPDLNEDDTVQPDQEIVLPTYTGLDLY